MRRLLIMLPVLALACGSKSLDLQAAPHITSSTDPTVVGAIDEQVSRIAVDAERIYWMGSQGWWSPDGVAPTALRSCKKADCENSLVTYDSGHAGPEFGFAVRDGQIYWFHFLGPFSKPRWSIFACEVAGCKGGTPTQTTPSGLDGYGLAVAYGSDAIYASVQLDADSITVYRIPFPGHTGPAELTTSATGDVLALGIHGDYLYWAEGEATPTPPPSTLRRARVSGNETPQTLAKNVQLANYGYGADVLCPRGLAFDSSYIYWRQGTLDGAIQRCPLSGCAGAAEVVVAPIRSPLSVLVADSKLYWIHDTRAQGLALSSCTIGNCASPELNAAYLASITALALDDQYLYTATTDHAFPPVSTWDHSLAQIRRLPR